MKIALLGSKGTTLDLLRNARFNIDRVLVLNPTTAERIKVAFHQGPRIVDACRQRGIDCRILDTYSLDGEEDKFRGIDLLLVIGWERLVPAAVLNVLGEFACGMHGSAYGLPRGRGRSPLNWSIITGHTLFTTYLFRYTPGMDDGDIIGSRSFEITDQDDIGSLHAKNRIAMTQLAEKYIPLIERGEACFSPQPPGEPSFYPKRTPEDGGIDWNRSVEDVCRLVRAVSYPYPSAFTEVDGTRFRINEATLFTRCMFRAAPGEIVDVSCALEQFAVQAGDGTVLVRRFEGIRIDDLNIGASLRSLPQPDFTCRYPASVPSTAREI